VTLNEPTDDELMGAAGAGDATAFDTLVNRHRGWVRSILQAFVRDHDLAEDLAQDVFYRAHAHAATYLPQGQFVAWMKRITVNVGRSAFGRKDRGNLSLSDCGDIGDVGRQSDPIALLMADIVQAEVRDAVQSLPDEQRLAVVMRYFGAMSIQEIAWAMKCPEGTVKSRIFHALRRVRATLDGPSD
jgi:RNA polymerase sigma-70 factor (ECF subfamily)